jgi:hypothetical protein
MITQAPIEITESFKFFGLELGVKQKTVKEAYRRYVKEFHPDLFPRDSDEQKMAAEKLIKANEHFEHLNAFFEQAKSNPESESQPKPKAKPKEEPKNQDDWADWEQQRHEAWDIELRDWVAAIAKIENDKKRARSKRDKSWLVHFARAFVVLSLLVLWSGYFSENKAVDAKVAERRTRIAQAEATGNPIAVQWAKHTIDVEDHGFTGVDGGANWDKRTEEQPFKIIPMLFWTVVGLAIVFSRKARDLADKLLEKPGTRVMMANKEAV